MLTPVLVVTQVGQEAAIVSQIRPKVSAVFEYSRFVRGSIYIEAGSLMDVTDAIKGVAGINIHQRIQSIPSEERSSLLNLGRSIEDLGPWARVCGRGKYHKDLAYVSHISLETQTALVLLVPRISSYKRKFDKGKPKQVAPKRPSPSIFDFRQVTNSEPLDRGRVKYKGDIYFNGLLELSLPLTKLVVASPPPFAAELDIFGRSEAIKKSVMVRAWSEFAAANLVPGNRVQITSGEQAGLIGKVLEVVDGIAKCVLDLTEILVEVPITGVRLYLCVGDYVQVNVGANVGKFGGIIEVERGGDTDIVTFTDDDTIRTGQPEQVSRRFFFVDLSITFFRSRCQRTSSRCTTGLSNRLFSLIRPFRNKTLQSSPPQK